MYTKSSCGSSGGRDREIADFNALTAQFEEAMRAINNMMPDLPPEKQAALAIHARTARVAHTGFLDRFCLDPTAI